MNSLKNKKEFDLVYKKGTRRYSKYFTLYFLGLDSRSPLLQNRENEDDFLLGLSVSKKVGKATKRNLIKRRVRSLCREHQEIFKNHAMVFVAKNGIIEIPYKVFQQDFLTSVKGLFSSIPSVYGSKS
ncbi:ribonuclease P protein component [Helicobacter sp. 13S00482-2]|uniref:ribonuclease P protein component n=1 Tax=Helicobacter sp. 13S00482-2 TaxID=1476200 RepID=UPI000BA67649|nr:ribonuclease P protein component [Helicobacter sp. 13S00482-2]PAF53312.1 ribonuclease P protein component [Helicobacter sp. 13S00482-2]